MPLPGAIKEDMREIQNRLNQCDRYEAVNADLLEALEGICDRAIGNSTGSFTIGVGHIKHARELVAKARKE